MSANGISNLPSKEAKQIAKLELASQDRLAVGNPRSFYDITQLPSRYIGDQTVDNPNPDGLILGRPWIVFQPVINLIINGDFANDANAHNYLVNAKGWIITDGGETSDN